MFSVDDDRETVWNVVAAGTAVLAGMAARRGVKALWRRSSGREPPENPVARNVGWAEAMSWAVMSGTAVAVTRLVARRAAAAGWTLVDGREPPA